jgi:hypothetical protein
MKTAAIMAMLLAAALTTPALAQSQAQLNQLHQQQLRQLRQQQQAQKNALRQQQRNYNYNSRVYNGNWGGRTDAQYRQALIQQIGNTMDAGQKAILIQRLRAMDGRWW